MSNNTATLDQLPDEVATTTRSWRFAKGVISTGREEDGTYETRPSILGYLRRVGIHEGETQDGTPYAKLEAVIETKEGNVSIGASLKGANNGGKPTYSSCISFAEGLLDCDKDEIIQIKAAPSKKPNKYGTHSTYANVYHVRNANSAERTKDYPYPSGTEWGDPQLEILLEEIKQHPAYGERPKRDSQEDEAEAPATPFDNFCAALSTKGWPGFGIAEDEYLAIAGKVGKKTYKASGDVPDDVWAEMQKVVDSGKAMPPAIQKIADEQKADEHDPFAED